MSENALDIDQKLQNAELLILGCSAGGFLLVYNFLLKLPANFPLPVVVIIHRSRSYKSLIEEHLNGLSSLNIKMADDKESIKSGTVYFAPPDYHLLVETDKTLSLDNSEPVHFCRPAIDVTFQTAADTYQDKLIAILLSGANSDGADGMEYISELNGLTIVQQPEEAEVDIMPKAAINRGNIDLVLKMDEITSLIHKIVKLKSNF
ncbi:MAG: chemotaxis protein CheB [Daejeonella sp.]